MSVKITKDNVDSFLKNIKQLTTNDVLVGVPADKSVRSDDAANEPINNAEIGYLMEFGSPAQNIPERPFLIPSIKESQDKFAKTLKAGAAKAVDGDAKAAVFTLNKVGIMAQIAVQEKIDAANFTSLSERTLAARRAKGRTGTKPLTDTAQLRNSINYVIISKAK